MVARHATLVRPALLITGTQQVLPVQASLSNIIIIEANSRSIDRERDGSGLIDTYPSYAAGSAAKPKTRRRERPDIFRGGKLLMVIGQAFTTGMTNILTVDRAGVPVCTVEHLQGEP